MVTNMTKWPVAPSLLRGQPMFNKMFPVCGKMDKRAFGKFSVKLVDLKKGPLCPWVCP